MRYRLPGLGTCLFLLLGLPTAAQSPPTERWTPAKTWVFAVGVLEFASDDLSEWPAEGRKDAVLVELLARRGVPEEQISFLEDRAATHAAIHESFAKFVQRPGPGDVLIVYFTGHGVRVEDGATYFTPHDYDGPRTPETGWSVRSVFDVIEREYRGTRALLLADCCYSGALETEARRRKGSRISFACLSSSSASTPSTGNWTFTECLIRGFEGAAIVDANGDRSVELTELARYTEAEMAFVDGQLSTFGTTGTFDPTWKIAEVDRAIAPGIGKRVMVECEGSWYRSRVLAVQGEKLRIHYLGWSSDEDEWVGPDRVKRWEPEHLEKGVLVEVEWNGVWYPARVLDAKLGLHQITYDGYPSVWDEWVGGSRIRLRD